MCFFFLNIGKTKYTETDNHQGIVSNEHLIIGGNFYEKVEAFKYLDYDDVSKCWG